MQRNLRQSTSKTNMEWTRATNDTMRDGEYKNQQIAINYLPDPLYLRSSVHSSPRPRLFCRFILQEPQNIREESNAFGSSFFSSSDKIFRRCEGGEGWRRREWTDGSKYTKHLPNHILTCCQLGDFYLFVAKKRQLVDKESYLSPCEAKKRERETYMHTRSLLLIVVVIYHMCRKSLCWDRSGTWSGDDFCRKTRTPLFLDILISISLHLYGDVVKSKIVSILPSLGFNNYHERGSLITVHWL